MKRILTITWLCFFLSGFALHAQAQAVSGIVKDNAGEALIGVSVTVKGTFIGTTTDVKGNFSIKPDFSKGSNTLVFSYVGYQPVEQEVTPGQTGISITMEESTFMADEVIVSASRVEERIMETPVTVEAVSAKQLQTQGSSEIFSSLSRFKGIDVNQSSLLLSSLSTRGFNSAKSERVIQMTDLADNMSPSLSLYAGNINGAPEIDIESVDIIHGANSSLYGANAFNGVILTTTKDPFKYEGLTVDLRGGTRDLFEGSIRIAAKIGERFAFKMTASYFSANDFIAEGLTPVNRRVVPANNGIDDPRGYDAVNRYGEIAFATASTNTPAGTLGSLGWTGSAFLPGFSELELVGEDYKATSLRLNPSLHFLITDKIKASYEYRLGQGGGIYQSSNRYAWERLEFNMHKFEVKSDNWFVRAYRQADAPGDTYDLNFMALGMAAEQPYVAAPGGPAFPAGTTYASAYGQTYIGTFVQNRLTGNSVQDSYIAAQQAVTAANIIPNGSDPRFPALREAGRNNQGAFNPSFNNNSNFWDFSTQYKIPIDFANIIVGASYRRFTLTSTGTLFADGDGSPIGGEERDEINNYEWGAYLQIQKALFNDRLKLAFAGRVDNFQNFDSKFSPRISAVYTVDEARKHNFRASYAQAFRAPAQVDQYIYLDIGSILLLSNIGENQAAGFNAISLAAAAGGDATPFFINPLKLEQMNTWEVGYKGILFEGFYIDLSYYRSNYTDFIGTQRFFGREDGSAPSLAELAAPPAPTDPGFRNRTRPMQVWLNADEEVVTEGFQLGFEYYAQKVFNITFNYTWSVISEVSEDFIVGFNTPEHKFNLGFNGEPFKNFNYNINLRYTDTYTYFMPFDEGVIQNFATVDAQLTYKASKLNTTFRLGGTNLSNSRAIQVYGAAPIGRIIYAGATFDMNIFKKN